MSEIYIPTEQAKQLDEISRAFDELCAVWMPHGKQVEAISALIIDGKTEHAWEWGRRTGKGDCMVACAGLWSRLVPHSQSYYFAPQRNQAEEIMWKSKKIEDVIPGNWIDEMLESELRVVWAGSVRRSSWFKLDGADKYDARRGIEPKRGLLFVDELREIVRGFWQAMEPILARWMSPVIFATTPPESLQDDDDPTKPHWVLDLFDRIAKKPNGSYIHATSYNNPHLSPEYLNEKHQEAKDRDEEDVFLREYGAERIPKKTGKSFSMLDRARHMRSHEEVLEEMGDRLEMFEWFCLTDPAGKSVWAWNFYAIHPFTRKIYVLDELDETKQANMTPTIMWADAYPKLLELYKDFDSWALHYDEAETWFCNDMANLYDVSFAPSDKTAREKSDGFSLIKDLLHADQVVISDRCVYTWWELENYENEKSRDHHVDLFRYLLNVSNYSAVTKAPPPVKKKPVHLDGRRTTLTQAIRQERESRDWTSRVLRKY